MSQEAHEIFSSTPAVNAETTQAAQAVTVSRADATRQIGDCGVKRTIYDMTPAERRVMRVLCDPENHELSDVERIRKARIGKTRYYEIINDPQFEAIERDTIKSYVRGTIGAIVRKAVTVATTKDRDGAADRWKLLEMSGHYTPRQAVDHTSAGQPIVGVIGVSMADL